MEKGLGLSQQSVSSANESGNNLTTILNLVTTIADLNRSIATAIEEQSVVAEQVTSNVNLVNELAVNSGEHGKLSRSENMKLQKQITIQSSLIAQFA